MHSLYTSFYGVEKNILCQPKAEMQGRELAGIIVLNSKKQKDGGSVYAEDGEVCF